MLEMCDFIAMFDFANGLMKRVFLDTSERYKSEGY